MKPTLNFDIRKLRPIAGEGEAAVNQVHISQAGRSIRVEQLSSKRIFSPECFAPTNMECDRAFDVFLDVGDRTGSRGVGREGRSQYSQSK